MNKSLVPEWPCIIEVSYIYPPTTGNPDIEKSRSHAPRYDTYVPLWTDISRRSSYFSSLLLIAFRFSCYLCCCWVPLQPQFSPFRRELLLIFVLFSRKFDRFWRHSDHCSLCFVLAVLLSSLTPATVSPFLSEFFLIFVVFRGNSTGFESSVPSFALCCSYCVVVESHSSHRFAVSPTG